MDILTPISEISSNVWSSLPPLDSFRSVTNAVTFAASYIRSSTDKDKVSKWAATTALSAVAASFFYAYAKLGQHGADLAAGLTFVVIAGRSLANATLDLNSRQKFFVASGAFVVGVISTVASQVITKGTFDPISLFNIGSLFFGCLSDVCANQTERRRTFIGLGVFSLALGIGTGNPEVMIKSAFDIEPARRGLKRTGNKIIPDFSCTKAFIRRVVPFGSPKAG